MAIEDGGTSLSRRSSISVGDVIVRRARVEANDRREWAADMLRGAYGLDPGTAQPHFRIDDHLCAETGTLPLSHLLSTHSTIYNQHCQS